MSIQSMTGFARAAAQADGWVVQVEVRSVNHRGLDTRVWVPRGLSWAEPQILQAVREHLQRGRVELRVDLEVESGSAEAKFRFFDSARFAAVCDELRLLSGAHAMADDGDHIALSDVIAFKHLFEATHDPQVDPDNPALQRALQEALARLVEARVQEGAGIAADLRGHLVELGGTLQELGQLLPEELGAFRERLRQRVSDAVAEFGVSGIDDERLAQELAFYADRSDVGEELQRAASHLGRLEALLDDGGAAAQKSEPCGKMLDFYLQEMIRETNTMASKSNSARGTDLIIAMKATIERMREQAANIE